MVGGHYRPNADADATGDQHGGTARDPRGSTG